MCVLQKRNIVVIIVTTPKKVKITKLKNEAVRVFKNGNAF